MSPPAPTAASAARFKAEMQGDEVVRMVPYKDGKANHGHSCVKGRFACGYATHRDRILKPMIRANDHRPLARSHLGRGDRSCRLRVQAHPGRVRPRLHRRHHFVALHQRRDLPGPEDGARRASATTTSIPARGSAIRPPATASRPTFGTSAGTQDFDSVDEADVIMIIGANPTDAHPVFASQMKRRLREGAKLIVARPAPDRPGAHAARRGGLPSAAAARHQRRASSTRWPTSSSPRDWSTRTSCASAATGRIRGLGGVRIAEPRN